MEDFLLVLKILAPISSLMIMMGIVYTFMIFMVGFIQRKELGMGFIGEFFERLKGNAIFQKTGLVDLLKESERMNKRIDEKVENLANVSKIKVVNKIEERKSDRKEYLKALDKLRNKQKENRKKMIDEMFGRVDGKEIGKEE